MSKVIWFINDYAGSKYHGMEYRNYYVARELVKKGFKVYIISASYMHLFKQLPQVKGDFTFEKIDGIDYVWIKVPHYSSSHDRKRIIKWFVFFHKLFKLPVKKMEKPDVIIVSPMAPFPILPGYRFAKKFNAKLIYEVKDIWPLSLMQLGGFSSRHPFIMFMQWFADFAYKKSDLTITVLQNAYEYMKDHGLQKDKFAYIPNGVSLEDMKNIEPLAEKTLALLPKGKFLVAYTGTLGVANSLDYLIRAAEILKNYKDIQFILVGDGQEKQHLRQLVEKLKLTNMLFIESIPKLQVQSLLKEIDVCYIGLRNEPLFKYGVSPNKLFDYMYSEKPIVFAINSGNRPVEEANCGISVEAENEHEIAEAILKLYKMSEEERKKLGMNGKEYVLKYHTYEKIADKYIEVLEEIK